MLLECSDLQGITFNQLTIANAKHVVFAFNKNFISRLHVHKVVGVFAMRLDKVLFFVE